MKPCLGKILFIGIVQITFGPYIHTKVAKHCFAILLLIFPLMPGNKDGLNEYALLITGKLARLSNGVQHEMAKQAAMLLFDNMKAIATNEIIEKLVEKESNKREIDWVNSICKKLPLMAVLKSFDFNEEDCDFILGKTEQLVKIMLPNKTPEQVAAINEISKEIYTITEKHLSATNFYKPLLNSISEKYKTGLVKQLLYV